MAATSPLKSASSAIPPEFFGDKDSDYAEKYQSAKDAEDKLMEMLERRNKSRLSPSMLAVAGALLDPGRTGSFGEAIGRAATAYANTQGVEDQQLRENAMARMQLANMQLDRAQSAKMYGLAAPYMQTLMGPKKMGEVMPEAAQAPAPASAAPASAVDDVVTEAKPAELLAGQSTIINPEAETPAVDAKAPASVSTAPVKPSSTASEITLPSLEEISTSPDIVINGRVINPQIIAGLKMLPATRAIGEAMEGLYNAELQRREFQLKTNEADRAKTKLQLDLEAEKRAKREAELKEEEEKRAAAKAKRDQGEYERGAIKPTPWGYMDLTDPKKPTPIYVPDPGKPDVKISFPEFNGESYLGSESDLIKLRKAREAKDPKGVEAIYNYLRYGVKGEASDANQGTPTVSGKEIAEKAKEKKAVVSAEAQAKETADFLKNEPNQRDTIFVSARIMNNAKTNAKMYGLLKKPGIGSAIAAFARDKGEVGEVAISKENIENFLRLKNVDTKDTDMTAVAEMSSDLARLHFNFRKQLLEKQGQVSDREDMGIAKIQGTASDTPEYLIKMAQLTGRKAKFDVEVAADFRAYRRDKKDPYMTLDEYKSDPSSNYGKVLKNYENWLEKTYNLPKDLASSGTDKDKNVAPLSKQSLDAILAKRKLKKQNAK